MVRINEEFRPEPCPNRRSALKGVVDEALIFVIISRGKVGNSNPRSTLHNPLFLAATRDIVMCCGRRNLNIPQPLEAKWIQGDSVPLSQNANGVLDALPSEGLRNRAFLVRQLSLSAAEVDEACEELIKAKLAERVRGRIARASANLVLPGLNKIARQVLNEIPTDGSSIGGAALRSAVSADNDAYSAALNELQQSGAITVGPGRGGSIKRQSRIEESPIERPTTLEKDLYQPFVDLLRSSWVTPNSDTLQEALVTATPRGYKQKSGSWTRPDVTELRVDRYELLPQGQRIQLEVSSYEIKPRGTPQIEWVFEAASHARSAHRSTLVLDTPDAKWIADDRFIGEVRRFNLGLYYMTLAETDRSATPRYDLRVVLEPGLQSPEPGDLQEAIDRFINLSKATDFRQRYRGAIGS